MHYFPGFVLGFFSFATIFANQILCAIFLILEPDFWPFFAKKGQVFDHFLQKKARCLAIFRKKIVSVKRMDRDSYM